MNIDEYFRSKYMRASDLNGKTIAARIEAVEEELIGQERQRKPVVYFKNHEHALVLNATNYRMLREHFGGETDEWIGHAVELFSEKVLFQNEWKDGLRIRVPAASQAKKVPAPAGTGAEDLDDDVNF